MNCTQKNVIVTSSNVNSHTWKSCSYCQSKCSVS